MILLSSVMSVALCVVGVLFGGGIGILLSTTVMRNALLKKVIKCLKKPRKR